MFSIKFKILTAGMLSLSLAVAAFGQQSAPPAAKSPDYVEEKGFKGRIFDVKHRDPEDLYSILRPLGSGFKGATISINREFKTITVRDFPENIAAIEEAIKRLDTPDSARPAQPDIEFHVHVLIASNAATPVEPFPAELSDVVKQLQATLRYKNYGLMMSEIRHGKIGGTVGGKGVAEAKLFGLPTPMDNPVFYNYQLQFLSSETPASGTPTVQTRMFNFEMRVPLMLSQTSSVQYENIGFNTPVSLREGEKVVVGTTTIKDKGLIVVLSAKLLK